MCKQIGKSYGFASRLALSYDFAFLSLMNLSMGNYEMCVEKQRCVAHPLRKRPCAVCGEGFEYPAAAAQILIYHKLRDDIRDSGIVKRLASGIALMLVKRGYKKAKGEYAGLATRIEELMKRQSEVEKKGGCGIDEAADASAEMMSEIAAGLLQNDKNGGSQECLGDLLRFGYCMGRYIYICDAADDLLRDLKKGRFNPLANELALGKKLTEAEMERTADYVVKSVNLTLGELADCYVKLELGNFKPILDNIVYLGLKDTCFQIIRERLQKTEGKDKAG